MAGEPNYPVGDLLGVMYACRADDPLQPGSPIRHDFSALRGRNTLNELAGTLLSQQPDGRFHHTILCGHRGSGKSTELLALKKWADENGFLTVWMEVDLYFGLAELHFSDLYLLAAEAVEREMGEINTPLPIDRVKSIVEWFAAIVQEDKSFDKSELAAEAGAQIGGAIPSLGKLFAKFTSSIKGSSEHHRSIRRTLRQSPNTLIDLTNALLSGANALLAEQGRPKGLLLLFDNLDRYEAENIKTLLLDGANLMLHLGAHTIFTMPINLHHNPAAPFWDDYGQPAVLPMLALRGRTERWEKTVQESAYVESAVDVMRAALARRIEIETLFENPEDARLVVKMSGGCIRDLLHLVGIAFQRSFRLDKRPTQLTHEGVQLAINQYRGDLAQGLRPEQFARLAAVARRRPEAQTLDEEALKLLALRILLRYSDANEQRWLDVHPQLIETEGFQRAFDAASILETH